jgi:hypothetical protein
MRLSQTRVARLFLVLVAVYISIGAILMTRTGLSIVSRDVVLDRNIIKYDKTVSSSSPDRVKPKTDICICCFSTKHAALRRKSKYWLSWNQDNVSEWGDMSICGLLFQ